MKDGFDYCELGKMKLVELYKLQFIKYKNGYANWFETKVIEERNRPNG